MGYPDYLVHYNKNHDKKTGRFTFGDGNGDGVKSDSENSIYGDPSAYRTKEADEIYKKYGSDISYVSNLRKEALTDPKKEYTDSEKKMFDFGIKVMDEVGIDYGPDYTDSGRWNYYEFLTDWYYGPLSQISVLAYKGYNKDKILDIIDASEKIFRQNMDFIEDAEEKVAEKNNRFIPSKDVNNIYELKPYKNDSSDLALIYTYIDEKVVNNYIDKCTELAKEMEHSDMDYSSMDYSEYLMHFNKNHDKKSGRFSFGDGDGDGIRDDHSNQSKKQSTSDGSKKTIMISSPKNPHNPFSGREKTKVEVSDEAYKEFMKADTKHDIIRGTSNLVTGGLYLAVGVLTENPVALGVGVASLVSSAVNYVDSGTHFVNKIVDSVYKDKPVGEIESLIKVDPSIFGNKKYYDPKTKEIVELSFKEANERNKAVGYK